MDLLGRIASGEARVGIIGLGYIGLPLAVEFAKAGLHVVGYDVDQSKVDSLRAGKSYIPDVPSEELSAVVNAGTFCATTDQRELANVDVINICVPTPLSKTREPYLSYLSGARSDAASCSGSWSFWSRRPTRDDRGNGAACWKRGLEGRARLLLAFSPERVDPGNQIPDGEHPESGGRDPPGEHRPGRGVLRAGLESVANSAWRKW